MADRGKIKYGGVIGTFMILFLVFTLALILVTFFYTGNIIAEEAQNVNEQVSMNLIETIGRSADSTIKGAANLLTQLSLHETVFKLVIQAPPSSNTTVSLAMVALSNATAESEVISDILLYIPQKDLVISSRFSSGSLKSSVFYPLISGYMDGSIDCSSFFWQNRTIYSFIFNGDVFLAREFPLDGSRRLGILFCRLDDKVLCDGWTNEAGETETTVYDETGRCIFGIDDPGTRQVLSSAAAEGTNGSFRDDQAEVVYFCYRSPLTKWCFTGKTLRDELIPTVGKTVYLISPLLVATVLICALLAFFLYRKIVAPVRILKREIEDIIVSDDSIGKNEFEFIRSHFTNILSSNDDLERVVNSVLPEVTHKFFSDLITGYPMTAEHIREMLDITKSSIDMQGSYCIVLIKSPEDALAGSDEKTQLFAVMQVLSRKAFCAVQYHAQLLSPTVLAVLLEIKPKDENSASLLIPKSLASEIEMQYTLLNMECSTAFGIICDSLIEISLSYKAALNSLSNDATAESADFVTEEDHRLLLQVERICSLTENGDVNSARKYAAYVINTLRKKPGYLSDPQHISLLFCDAHIAYLSSHGFRVSEELSGFRSQLASHQPVSVYNASFGTTLRLFQAALTASRPQQHKALQAAVEYIEKNYTNADLSLAEVAEYVRTTPSYLSKLFKSDLNVNYVDYLNNVRVNKALELIENTNLTIKEISERSGFNSQGNFIRVFKKHIGTTPGYIKQTKSNTEE